ncbi:MAG: hypothetical protein NTY64_21180, partial [Deltaproteobacteria bacterium]|nr:hypothetical protein [Deltaproteobacteria bacterium]
EEKNSPIQGGASFVKVAFRDGQTRIFDNNFRNSTCCYHAGLRRRQVPSIGLGLREIRAE